MEAKHIKTNILDSNLDRFLNPYKADGSDVTYGHVLVKKMDGSRPRPADGPKEKVWSEPNYPVTNYRAIQREIDGVYQLIPKKNLAQEGWIAWLAAIKRVKTSELPLGAFLNMIETKTFGNQTKDIAMLVHGVTGLRADLGIKQNPVASADSIYRVRSNKKNSQVPQVFVNTSGSPMEIETPTGGLTKVIYNHRGAPFQWIIVPPVSRTAFETYVKTLFIKEMGENGCSDAIKHLGLWITPNRLREMQVNFFEVKQGPAELLFLFPGCYYWGYSSGHNVIELKNHAGEAWNCNGWRFCKLANDLCHRVNHGQLGVVIGPLDGNKQQEGNEGGQMIDPTPRRTRKRKAVPHESVMEMGPDSPSSTPANPGAQQVYQQADVAEEYPVGQSVLVDTDNPFNDNDFAPGFGARHSPISNEDDNPPNKPEHTGGPYEYSYEGSDAAQQYQVEYLLQENHDLRQEREAAHQEIHYLRQCNENLASQTQNISSEREILLQEQLAKTIQQREDLFAMILERDNIIDGLNARLIGGASGQDQA